MPRPGGSTKRARAQCERKQGIVLPPRDGEKTHTHTDDCPAQRRAAAQRRCVVSSCALPRRRSRAYVDGAGLAVPGDLPMDPPAFGT